jgi:hypothetical protein
MKHPVFSFVSSLIQNSKVLSRYFELLDKYSLALSLPPTEIKRTVPPTPFESCLWRVNGMFLANPLSVVLGPLMLSVSNDTRVQ